MYIMPGQHEELMSDIHKLQQQYYNKNSKNILFKKAQKNECANMISNEIGIEIVLNQAIKPIPPNKILIDYTVLKTFAGPDNYNDINLFLAKHITQCIRSYGSIDVHVNLSTLTISALERHRSAIVKFTEFGQSNGYTSYVTNLSFYNTPSFVLTGASLLNTLLPHELNKIVKFYNKRESESLLKLLE
jgi:hypothetical protein